MYVIRLFAKELLKDWKDQHYCEWCDYCWDESILGNRKVSPDSDPTDFGEVEKKMKPIIGKFIDELDYRCEYYDVDIFSLVKYLHPDKKKIRLGYVLKTYKHYETAEVCPIDIPMEGREMDPNIEDKLREIILNDPELSIKVNLKGLLEEFEKQ